MRRWERADSRQIAYLDEIFIEEPFRGRGIGAWAIQSLLKKYEKKVNMLVARVALLTRCEPMLGFFTPEPTKREQAEFNARRDKVADFFAKVSVFALAPFIYNLIDLSFHLKIGFRRLGHTEFLGYHRNPNHPSRSLSAEDDPPYQDVLPPKTERERHRYMLMRSVSINCLGADN